MEGMFNEIVRGAFGNFFGNHFGDHDNRFDEHHDNFPHGHQFGFGLPGFSFDIGNPFSFPGNERIRRRKSPAGQGTDGVEDYNPHVQRMPPHWRHKPKNFSGTDGINDNDDIVIDIPKGPIDRI